MNEECNNITIEKIRLYSKLKDVQDNKEPNQIICKSSKYKFSY